MSRMWLVTLIAIFASIFLVVNCRKFLDQDMVSEMIKQSTNKTREALVKKTLEAAAGVYVDKEYGKKMGLAKTVFTTVIAFNSDGIFHYKIYFQNLICFTRHYGIDVVVYILHHHLQDVEAEIQSLTTLGVRVLTYPDELFWRLLATKKSNLIPADKRRADYSGNIPTFKTHGALCMLVPTMEVLNLGFNAIFFDVDIGFVQDPVPYLIRGDADFVTSFEVRQCPELYPSYSAQDYPWYTVEGNTGVMHVRATTQGVKMFRRWLEEIVDENLLNDQYALNWKLFDAVYTPNCNWNLSAVPSIRPRADNATFCIVPEILFQNGLVAFTCSTKPAFREDWVLEMHNRATEMDGRHYPVTIHANYCNGKSHELNIRGLWLREETVLPSDSKKGKVPDNDTFTCKPYDIKKTWFTTVNHTEEVVHIRAKRGAIRAAVVKNGTLIKRVGGDEIFLMDEHGFKHSIPNADTFEFLGFHWGHVKNIPTFVMQTIPAGDPIPPCTNC